MHMPSHTLPQLQQDDSSFQNGQLKITATNLVLNLSICARFKNKEQCQETEPDPFVFLSQLSIQLCLFRYPLAYYTIWTVEHWTHGQT